MELIAQLKKLENGSAPLGPFVINRCFICHKSAVETTLKRCGACKMVSYCGEKHQKQDWKNHKTFCAVVKKIESGLPQQNLDNKKLWFAYRNSFLKLCERELQRTLEQHELEMIGFPKRCEICRSVNANIICNDCLCVNYCSEEHKLKDSEFHAKNCNDLKQAVDMDLHTTSIGTKILWNWSLRKNVSYQPENIQGFIRSSINMGVGKISQDQRRIAEIILSYDITYPLSLMHGLNLLHIDVKDKLIVHIVGAEAQETLNLQKWEILLHVYPQIKKLMIFFIGPFIDDPVKTEMCTSCTKIFEYKFIRDLYHDFVKTSEYQKPDIVCTFNPGFYHSKAQPSFPWLKSLPLLFKDAPWIMTSFNALEVQYDKDIILNVNPNLIFKATKNPFASLLPIRSLSDAVVDYINYYISLILKDPSKN